MHNVIYLTLKRLLEQSFKEAGISAPIDYDLGQYLLRPDTGQPNQLAAQAVYIGISSYTPQLHGDGEGHNGEPVAIAEGVTIRLIIATHNLSIGDEHLDNTHFKTFEHVRNFCRKRVLHLSTLTDTIEAGSLNDKVLASSFAPGLIEPDLQPGSSLLVTQANYLTNIFEYTEKTYLQTQNTPTFVVSVSV